MKTQGIYGPQTCTAYGDPFSPWNSPWEPNQYTYQFRIVIPADYYGDIVRVELFDPDSVNTADNETTILHTSNARNTGGMPLVATKFCGTHGGSSDQKNPCVVTIDEMTLVDNGTFDINQINPFWLVRIDENQGGGNPTNHGDGTCAVPDAYQPGFNTQTLFQLHYYRETNEETTVRVELASYTGFTGDPSRDFHSDHQTDMRWVSPGADKQGNDYPIADVPDVSEVPTSEGDTSFEVNLNDIPDIVVDEYTGDRYLWVDVTSLSGASENGFEIWAGPADYVDTTATDVNQRNLAAIDSPGSHDARGVRVEAVGRLPVKKLHAEPFGWPLLNVPAGLEGSTLTVSIFDLDTNMQPPVTFYFDSIPESYWSLPFGQSGVDDSDGVPSGSRCDIGGTPGCDNRWITPPYHITIPGNMEICDPQNPTQADCTPFYGGRLMVRYSGGEYDTSSWQILTNPERIDVDTTQGCTAFPIAVSNAIRSVTVPGSANPYPDAAAFDYPAAPPTYNGFPDHKDAVSLGEPGSLYKLERGFGIDNFGWLKWNLGITGIGASAGDTAVLSHSLTWPGDSFDYSNHDDQGTPAADGILHVVRGYVKPGDATDQAMHVDDWVAANSAQLPQIASTVNTLIDDGPVLRLIVWDTAEDVGGFPPNGRFFIQRFGLFKLIGYGNSDNDNEWLLLEFMGWDDSCGQLAEGELTIGFLQIVDPAPVYVGDPFTVTATITNTGPGNVNDQFFVEFYLNPATTDNFPAESIVGFTAVSALNADESRTITLVVAPGSDQPGTNNLYAMVDAGNQIAESDETNNIAGPLSFDLLPLVDIYLPLVQRQQ